MAETVRNWFNSGSTNLFAPAPGVTPEPPETNSYSSPTQSLASPSFGGSTNAWDMPSYGGSTNTTAPSGSQTLASPNFSSPTNAWSMPTYGGLQPTPAPTTNTLASPNFTNTNPTTVSSALKPSAPQPAPAVSSSGQTGGGQQPAAGMSWDWFGGQNPWNTNVTAGTVNPDLSAGPQTSFTQSGWNVNYPTEGAANQLGQMFGANVLGQNMSGDWGPAGAPSSPMYGLDFGIGDPQNAGQVAFWLQRGDSIADIQARLAAGINPPLGPGQASPIDWNFANPIYTTPGAPGNGTVNTGLQPSTHLGPIGGPTTNLQPGAVSGGGTVQVPGTPGTGATGTPTSPTPGNAPIDWASWQAFLNSNYFPLAEPGADAGNINQNFSSQMLQNPTLAAFLGITPQSSTPTGGQTNSSNTNDNTGINALFRALGLTGSGNQQQMNPFFSTFLQSLLYTPQMYLR